jgi:hypothetical protein
MRGLSLLLAVSVSLGACSTDPNATRLSLQTDAFQVVPGACQLAAAAPFKIERDGTDMVFVEVGTGSRRSIIWPFGFAAWLEAGVATLYATDGTVVGREGDVLDNIGGAGVEGEGFHVCSVGARTYT